MSNSNRFHKIYSQGQLTTMEIWVDLETGVNYLYHRDGYSGGFTPLLDKDGEVVVAGKNEQRMCPGKEEE